jgi:hypothetical protein
MKLASTLILAEAMERDQMFRPKDYGQPLVNSPQNQKTVCVDFDGVLTHVSGPYLWGHIGAVRPEGIKFLKMLQAEGFHVVILTARHETDMVAKWLAQQGVPGLMVTNHKISAIAYVDDHAALWHDAENANEMMQLIRKAAR